METTFVKLNKETFSALTEDQQAEHLALVAEAGLSKEERTEYLEALQSEEQPSDDDRERLTIVGEFTRASEFEDNVVIRLSLPNKATAQKVYDAIEAFYPHSEITMDKLENKTVTDKNGIETFNYGRIKISPTYRQVEFSIPLHLYRKASIIEGTDVSLVLVKRSKTDGYIDEKGEKVPFKHNQVDIDLANMSFTSGILSKADNKTINTLKARGKQFPDMKADFSRAIMEVMVSAGTSQVKMAKFMSK